VPRKVFVAGEILTAADVNTNLMDQAVMVFDDSAARGSAIPSPIEGMVTYLKDSDQLFKYTTDWVPAGGLVAVKSAIRTSPLVVAGVAAGANTTVTDLSITHEVQNAANKLIISAFLGAAGRDTPGVADGLAEVGLAVHDGTSLIAVGDAAGSRTQVSAGGRVTATGTNIIVTMPSITFVHTPGSGSKTYTVRAINVSSSTSSLYINRTPGDADEVQRPRSVSSLVIQEVAV
jgi:hypothetical protein